MLCKVLFERLIMIISSLAIVIIRKCFLRMAYEYDDPDNMKGKGSLEKAPGTSGVQ